jgi:predicted Zn-dependent peptidase
VVASERPELGRIECLLCFEGGRAAEPAELLGLSDLLAAALHYGGPTSRSGEEFHARLAERGASLEVLAADDALELELASRPEDLGWVLDAAAELVLSPHYPPEVVELARERLIDRLEREADDPSAVADAFLAARAFGADDPAARRASCATAEAIGREELVAFHRAQFARDRLWAAAVGPIDAAELARELERAFAPLPLSAPAGADPVPRPAQRPEEGRATGTGTALVLPRSSRIELRLWAPGVALTDPDYAALRLWSDVAGRRAGGGAFFAADWQGRAGLYAFASTPEDPRAASAALAGLEGYLGGPALLPLGPEPFAAAQARLLAAHAEREADPRAWLEPLRFGAPADFWSRHGAELAAATPASVARAVERQLPSQAWIRVGVFPEAPAGWPADWELADGTRPLRGTPEAVALLERAFAALGGREAWAALDGLVLEGELRADESSAPVAVSIWRDFAGERVRTEEWRDGTERVQIATPEGAVAVEMGAVAALDGDVHAAVVGRERALLYRVLRELARATTHSVELDGAGRLAVRRRGRPLCAIELSPDGRPARVVVPESRLEWARTTEFHDWAPHGAAGLWFAGETRDGSAQTGTRRFRWRWIDPDWVPDEASFSTAAGG